MGNYLSVVSELIEIRRKKFELAQREAEISVPRLTDLDLIPEIYQLFTRLCPQEQERRRSVRSRKQFIFIILMFYSPAALAGDRMVDGLRNKLAEVVKITSRSAISNNNTDLVFLYETYKDFRYETDCLYREVESYLRQKARIT